MKVCILNNRQSVGQYPCRGDSAVVSKAPMHFVNSGFLASAAASLLATECRFNKWKTADPAAGGSATANDPAGCRCPRPLIVPI